MEEYSFKVGEPVAPAYYKMLNSIYKKEKDREGQEKSLYRYLIQIKARGVSAKKMFDTYKKINPNIDSIYPDYLLNLKKCEVPIFSYTCPHCKEQIKLPKILSPSPARKDYTSIFGTSCPKCFESFITVYKTLPFLGEGYARNEILDMWIKKLNMRSRLDFVTKGNRPFRIINWM